MQRIKSYLLAFTLVFSFASPALGEDIGDQRPIKISVSSVEQPRPTEDIGNQRLV